jgi:hypothetical protein
LTIQRCQKISRIERYDVDASRVCGCEGDFAGLFINQVAGTGFGPVTFSHESISRALFKRLVKSERFNFSSGTEVRITVAERYRRLIVSSQALCSTCPISTPSSPIPTRAFSTSSPNPDIRF